MKALVNTAPGELELQERPLPEPAAGQVRVRTAYCAICATDLVMIDGCARSHFPQILGHEWCGVIDTIGDSVDSALVGQTCVASNVLADGREVGFEHDGAYGEFFLTEAANVQVLPGAAPAAAMALVEPLAVCMRAMRCLRLTNTASAIIFGDGLIGLLMLKLLQHAGVKRTVVVGGREDRLSQAVACGASQTVNYHRVGADLADHLQNQGPFETLIEASGSAAAMDACVRLAAPGGHVLMLGDYDGVRLEIACQHFLHNELELIASCASGGGWPDAVSYFCTHREAIDELVTATFPVADFAAAFDRVRDRTGNAIKVVLEWAAT